LLIATVAACSRSADTDQTGDAIAVAETWLRQVDAGEYHQSWDHAAAFFKTAVTREQWGQTLDFARKPLGDLVTRKVKAAKVATSLPGAPDGQYVVIQFKTEFAHKKSAVETVTPMLDPDGVWRVSGYYIK
jgi:hypothetical protein